MDYVWTRYHWLGYLAVVSVILFFDLFVMHKKDEEPSFKTSALWTVFWCMLALAFNGLIYYWAGKEKAVEFLTGYLVEWSLSMDNVFVFAVIFKFFSIPLKNQYRVLFWGILGAVIMRFAFIFAGIELLSRFHWLMSIFGGFLVFSGVKLLFHNDEDVHPDQNIVMRVAKKFLPLAPDVNHHDFWVRKDGKFYFTGLFLVLLVIESSDVIFALDSVPAIFGITTDAYIVFTSNICAILGLRALYFLLAGIMDMFKYLSVGLSAILIFVGLKMNIEFWLPKEPGEHWISPTQSLLVILGILFIAIISSIISNRHSRGPS